MQVRRHDATASRTVRFGYTVSGSSIFPLDMLRYDGSFPATSIDAAEIADSLYRVEPKRRIINLLTTRDATWLPTQARWRSYGWRVE